MSFYVLDFELKSLGKGHHSTLCRLVGGNVLSILWCVFGLVPSFGVTWTSSGLYLAYGLLSLGSTSSGASK